MSNTEYPIAAHLINSRLQLIREKIVWQRVRRPDELVSRNSYYFMSSVSSISQYHNIVCEPSDVLYAAHLFLISVGMIHKVRKLVVVYGSGKKARPVTTPDNGITILPAPENEHLTEKMARERLKQLRNHHGIAFFSLVFKDIYSEYKP